MSHQRILFLCVQNSARSQMAEGMARHFLGHQADVASAGSQPGLRIHPMAIAVMAEIGIDISHHKPKSLEDFDIKKFDIVVTLCAEEQCPILPSQVKKMSWALPDPAGHDLPDDQLIKKFRKIRDDIRKKVLSLRAADQVW
jgi:arsenate reductase (thioredoxin)